MINNIQILNQLVEAIIVANEDEIAQVFHQEVAADQVARVERRLKFMLHPDRNCHKMAKEAFQRLSNSKWKLKYTKLLSSTCWQSSIHMILCNLPELIFAATEIQVAMCA